MGPEVPVLPTEPPVWQPVGQDPCPWLPLLCDTKPTTTRPCNSPPSSHPLHLHLRPDTAIEYLRVWQAEGWQPGTPTPTDSDNTCRKEGGNTSSQVPRPRNNCFLKKNNFDYKSKNIQKDWKFFYDTIYKNQSLIFFLWITGIFVIDHCKMIITFSFVLFPVNYLESLVRTSLGGLESCFDRAETR